MAKVENEIVKLNVLTAEHSRSLIKLVDNNERINRLEKQYSNDSFPIKMYKERWRKQ